MWPRTALKTSGTVSPYKDRPSPVNNMFIFFCLIEDERRQIV